MKGPKRAALAHKALSGRELASGGPVKIVKKPSANRREITPLQAAVIQELARGRLLHEVARKYMHHLAPSAKTDKKRSVAARTRLRQWMSTQKFRDLLWEETMIGLELDHPQHVRGLSRKAAAGRVDAARLAMELTGRHAPHTEVQPAQINIHIAGVDRPRRSVQDADVEADPDAEVEDAEWEALGG